MNLTMYSHKREQKVYRNGVSPRRENSKTDRTSVDLLQDLAPKSRVLPRTREGTRKKGDHRFSQLSDGERRAKRSLSRLEKGRSHELQGMVVGIV